jgi:ketosteroid isomerase-like protein
VDDGTSGEAELNRRTISKAFDAWQQGTAPITEVFAPDMVWRIEGHSAASKRYENTQQFIDEVLAPFGARFASGHPSAHSGSAPFTRTGTR